MFKCGIKKARSQILSLSRENILQEQKSERRNAMIIWVCRLCTFLLSSFALLTKQAAVPLISTAHNRRGKAKAKTFLNTHYSLSLQRKETCCTCAAVNLSKFPYKREWKPKTALNCLRRRAPFGNSRKLRISARVKIDWTHQKEKRRNISVSLNKFFINCNVNRQSCYFRLGQKKLFIRLVIALQRNLWV